MKVSFSKYQGTGNDFILLDNRQGLYTGLNRTHIEFLCNRRFGIGADGLILLENKAGYDFDMKYYNSDGKQSSMCGNGGRCITAYANALNLVKEEAGFTAIDGEHRSRIISQKPLVVKLKMKDVDGYEEIGKDLFLDTGSPHYVRFTEDVMKLDVVAEGRRIRYAERFKEAGTNVNFAQWLAPRLIVRSYERGVEDETLSCGTGVTASVLAAVVKGLVKAESGKCDVQSMGGMLSVYFKQNANGFEEVWLEGEATFVYSGEIEIQI